MKYRVEGGVATFGADMVLELTPDQADARAYALEKVGKGWRPTQPVHFIAGEVIGLDVAHDKLPGVLANVLVPEGKPAKGKPAKTELRTDGPTVAEFVAKGYLASNYPPTGYASRSTAEEIAAAIAEENKKKEGGGA